MSADGTLISEWTESSREAKGCETAPGMDDSSPCKIRASLGGRRRWRTGVAGAAGERRRSRGAEQPRSVRLTGESTCDRVVLTGG
jgi:hypothetical protein